MKTTSPPAAASVHALVPLAHVQDVDESLRFYALLGFKKRDVMARNAKTVWAWAACNAGPGDERAPAFNSGANIMFAQAGPSLDADAQAVLFYMYCDDIRALRQHLIDHGVTDAGPYCGQPLHLLPTAGKRLVFDVSTPAHMPLGELRIHDPDAYCILVGQLAPRGR
ncbi:MAG: hypothetical protein SFZ23_02795 [Planctomycetota bacterium]|nr:hypothetical protein [Planctomycetota bacterium]